MHQNITLKLPKAILGMAKSVAAREGTSVSRLMIHALRALVERKGGYQKAQTGALKLMRKKWNFGGGPYADRASLHQR